MAKAQRPPRGVTRNEATRRIEAPTTEFDETLGAFKVRELPTAEQMLRLTNDELLQVLQRFEVSKSWPDAHSSVQDYVRRMANIPPNRPDLFDAEVARLTNGVSRRSVLGLVRRTQENYTTSRISSGDPNQEFIRILDSHDNNCGPCIDLAGTIGTMAEHVAQGLPGPASCDGGDYCRCTLHVFE